MSGLPCPLPSLYLHTIWIFWTCSPPLDNTEPPKFESERATGCIGSPHSTWFALTAAPGGMGSFPFSNGPSSAPFGAGSAFLPGLPPDLANLIPGRIEPLGTRPPSIPPSGAGATPDCYAAES
jgi:hypothetical protein